MAPLAEKRYKLNTGAEIPALGFGTHLPSLTNLAHN